MKKFEPDRSLEANGNSQALAWNHCEGGYRHVLLEGSSRSGKTWAIIGYLLECLWFTPELVVTCFRHDGTTHEKSTIRDTRRYLAEYLPGVASAVTWNTQLKTCTFPNGSVMEFAATNDIEKLHGPERDIAWLNEVMEMGLLAYRQIAMRTRQLVIMDWNPSLTQHWVFERVMTQDDVVYVHTTYADNPHLSPAQVAEIKSYNPKDPENVRQGTADHFHWSVYGQGLRCRREGVIYPHWRTTDTWPDPMMCTRHGYGLDFGFADDEMALAECCIFQGDLWIRERVYETGLIVGKSSSQPGAPSLIGKMEEMGLSGREMPRIHADMARPDLIREMVLAGYPCGGVKKGPGSVLAGINLVNTFRIVVDIHSQGLQRELEQYVWKRDKATGAWLQEPVDKFNHLLDAVRYWVMAEVRSAQAGNGQRQGSYVAETGLGGRRR